MKIRKTTLILPVAGLLGGLGLSYLVPARYTAMAIVALRETATETSVPEAHRALAEFFSHNLSEFLSDASISLMIQSVGIYKPERDQGSIEAAIARTRDAIKVAVADSPSPFLSAYSISYTGASEDTTSKMVNAMITRLIQGHVSALNDLASERDKTLKAQIAELKARVAALEDRAGVKPPQPRRAPEVRDLSPEWSSMMNAGASARLLQEQVVFDILEAPAVKKVFPNTFAFMIGGAALGVISAIFVSIVR